MSNEKVSKILWVAIITCVVFTFINVVCLFSIISRLNSADMDIQAKYSAEYSSFINKIQTENPKAQIKITPPNENCFAKDFYETQTNWLNIWMVLLGLAVGIIGIAIPIMTKDQMERFEKAFRAIQREALKKLRTIKKDAETTISKLNTINDEANKTLENIKNYDTEQLSGQVEQIADNLTKIEEERIAIQTILDQELCSIKVKQANYFNIVEDVRSNLKEIQEKFDAPRENIKNLKLSRQEVLDYKKAKKEYDTADELYKNKNWEEAIKYFKKAIAIKPDFIAAWGNMGLAYSSLGDQDEAIKCYLEVLKINKNDFLAYNNIGKAYGQKNEFDEALKYLKKAEKLKPESDITKFNIALTYGRMDEYEKALPFIKKAVNLNNTDNENNALLSYVYYCLKQPEKALEYINIALDSNSNNPKYKELKQQIIETIKASEVETRDEE